MFRGEFVGLNGAADFYAADLEGLKREGKISLEVFWSLPGRIAPKKQAGRFALRLDPETYQSVAYCRLCFGKEYQSVYRGQPEAVRAGGLRRIDMCAAIHPGEILREEYMAPLGRRECLCHRPRHPRHTDS